jgi:hypothetical protein
MGNSTRTALRSPRIAETRAVLAHNFFLSPTKLEPEAVLLAILASLSPDAPLL